MNIKPFFVYGTLKEGFRNYHLLAGRVATIKPATIEGFEMFSRGMFPYVLRTQKPSIIHGQIMEVKPDEYDSVLTDLDRLEGTPSHYRREEITISGTACWIYVGVNEDYIRKLPSIASGIWE